jgi:MFS transporter, DHA3 family, macrolide efflux protein
VLRNAAWMRMRVKGQVRIRRVLSTTPPEAAVRRLAFARFVSWAGTQAAYIALIALIYGRSGGSGVWISAALLAALGARVVVSPWAGSLGDYFDRRLVMVVSDLAAATCFLALATVHSLPVLVALAALAGAAEAPFSPASGALITMLVPEERRGWGNGLLSAGSSSGMLLGAALGGVLVATFGAPIAFLLNAASFVVSAAFASSVRGRFIVERLDEAEHRGVLKGVQFLLRERALRLSTVSLALLALALGMTNVAELPFFVHIGAGRVGFGIAVAAWGAGQITGSRLASRVTDARRERLALIVGGVLAAGALGLSGALPFFVLVALLFAVAGVGNSFLNIGVVLMVQRWSPAQIQGRTLAAVEAVANTAIGVSLLAGGLLLTPLGARGVYLLAGGLGALAVAVSLRIPREPSEIRPNEQSVAPTQREQIQRIDPLGYTPTPVRA